MKSIKKITTVVGILLLIQFGAGVLINQFLVGPITFATDFLSSISANSNHIKLGVLLGLVEGVIGISIAVMLLPIFKQYNRNMAYLYFGLSIVSFTITAIDNTFILSLLSLSQEYIKVGMSDTNNLETIGDIFYQIRWWTHYMIMLVASFPLFAFYYVLFRSKLIPRFISIWGIVATGLMLSAILLAIFDQGTNMTLFLPLGVNHLFIAIWLIVKGFNVSIIPDFISAKKVTDNK